MHHIIFIQSSTKGTLFVSMSWPPWMMLQCLINIWFNFAGIDFLSKNFSLIGLRLRIFFSNYAFMLLYHHLVCFIYSFTRPSIWQSIFTLAFFPLVQSLENIFFRETESKYLGFVGHSVSVAITPLCHCSVKAAKTIHNKSVWLGSNKTWFMKTRRCGSGGGGFDHCPVCRFLLKSVFSSFTNSPHLYSNRHKTESSEDHITLLLMSLQ